MDAFQASTLSIRIHFEWGDLNSPAAELIWGSVVCLSCLHRQ